MTRSIAPHAPARLTVSLVLVTIAVSVALSLALYVAVEGIIEALKRRQMDPVNWIARTLSPEDRRLTPDGE